MKEISVYAVTIIAICALVGVIIIITSFVQCHMADNKQINDYMIECAKVKSPLECAAATRITPRDP